MRLIGLFLIAASLSAPAAAEGELSSARAFLDAVRTEAGAGASLVECSGQLEQTCTIRLGKSFILTTQATTAGEILAVTLAHAEIEGDTPEQAAAYVGAVADVIAGEQSGEVTALLGEAIQTDGPVEKIISGVRYRADAGAEVLLDARPAQ